MRANHLNKGSILSALIFLIIISCLFCSFFLTTTFALEILPRMDYIGTAALYAFDYGSNDINTMSDLEKPYNYLSSFSSYSFYTQKYENESASHFKISNILDQRCMNANVVFVSGHGFSGGCNFYGNTAINVSDLYNMNNVDIAMWATCLSGNSNNSYGISMGQSAVNAGAKSSIGFPDTVTVSSSKTFTNRLFDKLVEGKTIDEAAKYAKSGLLWLWDNARDYIVFGNGNHTLVVNNRDLTKNQVNEETISKFNQEIVNGTWETISIDSNTYRFYKTVNSILTDYFYEVKYSDNNEIINIYCSKNADIGNEVLSTNNFSDYSLPSPKFNDNFAIKNITKYNVYCTIDNVLVPVELCYYDKVYNDGYSVQEVRCINLNNNTLIDYNLINSVD